MKSWINWAEIKIATELVFVYSLKDSKSASDLWLLLSKGNICGSFKRYFFPLKCYSNIRRHWDYNSSSIKMANKDLNTIVLLFCGGCNAHNNAIAFSQNGLKTQKSGTAALRKVMGAFWHWFTEVQNCSLKCWENGIGKRSYSSCSWTHSAHSPFSKGNDGQCTRRVPAGSCIYVSSKIPEIKLLPL